MKPYFALISAAALSFTFAPVASADQAVTSLPKASRRKPPAVAVEATAPVTAPIAAAVTENLPQAAKAPKQKRKTIDIYDQLPTGKLEIPTTATLPKSIRKTESVDGIYLETPQYNSARKARGSVSYALVHASKEAAAAAAHQRGAQPTGLPTCFMASLATPHSSQISWSSSFSSVTTVHNYKAAADPPSQRNGSVTLVRQDRVVSEDENKLKYQVTLAFVDAETLGARLFSTQTLELSLIDQLPGDVKVWGARSGDDVTFVVRRRLQRNHFFVGGLMLSNDGQHTTLSAQEQCPVVFSLKTGQNKASTSVLELETVIGIDVSTADERREARTRPMRIGFSSSWMSQDTKPVVTVSHGWSGRERKQGI